MNFVFQKKPPGTTRTRLGFTLLEVMIAVGVLFMCLFAVLALLSNSLASARKLQQRRDIDTSSIAGMLYVQLSSTNNVNEGPVEINLEEMFPGSRCRADVMQVGSNGLCQVNFDVERNQKVEAKLNFLIFLPQFRQGISKNLPQH